MRRLFDSLQSSVLRQGYLQNRSFLPNGLQRKTLLLASAVIAGTTLVYQRIEGEKKESIPPITFSALRQVVSLLTMAAGSKLMKASYMKVETEQSLCWI